LACGGFLVAQADWRDADSVQTGLGKRADIREFLLEASERLAYL